MPLYKSRKLKKKQETERRVRHRLTRDRRKLMLWAVQGSLTDYDRLRSGAVEFAPAKPEYIRNDEVNKLEHIDRNKMLGAIQKDRKRGGFFVDALSWLLDKIPFRKWSWSINLAQALLKPFKGSNLTEVDEQYARLVQAGYKDDRPASREHWVRQPQFDSSYISVWDNPDGHRVVVVRGTKKSWTDVGEDALIAIRGAPLNAIGKELRKVVDATPRGTIMDLAAHSLGTSLALVAYNSDPEIQRRIHETYLYNPAYTPFSKSITDKYEKDDSVRYFINLGDTVSLGGLSNKGPSNVVYRTPRSLNPMKNHVVQQWAGHAHEEDEGAPDHQYVEDFTGWDDPADDLQVSVDPVGPSDELIVDFGDDDFSERIAALNVE